MTTITTRYCPQTAEALGSIPDALLLVQLDHLQSLSGGRMRDGARWIYMRIREWQRDLLPSLSVRSIARIVSRLRDRGLIHTILDRDTTLYRIDYPRVATFFGESPPAWLTATLRRDAPSCDPDPRDTQVSPDAKAEIAPPVARHFVVPPTIGGTTKCHPPHHRGDDKMAGPTYMDHIDPGPQIHSLASVSHADSTPRSHRFIHQLIEAHNARPGWMTIPTGASEWRPTKDLVRLWEARCDGEADPGQATAIVESVRDDVRSPIGVIVAELRRRIERSPDSLTEAPQARMRGRQRYGAKRKAYGRAR